MTGADLVREMRDASAALDDGDRALLIGCGIDKFDITMIGKALIRVTGDTYEPDSACGKTAFVTAISVHDAIGPESDAPGTYVRFGDIVDLIAWHPRCPARWALRTGAAEWLGCIPPQYMQPAPVAIHRSPLAWFQAGCTGLALLSRSHGDCYRTLTWCRGGLIAEDIAHAAELRAILAHPWPAPKVSIARTLRLADAAD